MGRKNDAHQTQPLSARQRRAERGVIVIFPRLYPRFDPTGQVLAVKSYTVAQMRKKKDLTNWEKLRNMKEEDIDYSDIPIPTDEMISKRFYLKDSDLFKKIETKKITIELNSEVLSAYQSLGDDWENIINLALLEYAESNRIIE